MSEVFFYQLERGSLEQVLPGLLEKTRERGWRALVRCSSEERTRALDGHLWTWRDDSFLAHGLEKEPLAAEQPVLLACAPGNPNGADVLFLVDGAEPGNWAGNELAGFVRIVLVFDGRDPASLEQARTQWLEAKSGGHQVTYWQQNPAGRWEKRG